MMPHILALIAKLGPIQTLRLRDASRMLATTKLKNFWSQELARLAQTTFIQFHLMRIMMLETA
jgi:hypothetical protein